MLKEFKPTKEMRSKDLETAALAYAGYGLPVFPVCGINEELFPSCGWDECENAGKHPLIGGGFKSATTDLKQVKKWWKECPDANIGSPLIKDLFVLDFDGKKGRQTYQKLGFDTLDMLRVKTGKGMHLYVHSADLKTQNNVKPGLDIRGGGKGGYIILPPSRHVSGKCYKWEV